MISKVLNGKILVLVILTAGLFLNASFARDYYDINDAESYNNSGVDYYTRGNYDLAFADFNRAVELKPDLVQAYNNRGLVYYARGVYDKAIADFNKAIALKPDFVQAYTNRGTTYQSKGDLSLAIADFNKAIEMDPYNYRAFNNRGLIHYYRGEYDLAIFDFKNALTVSPTFAEASNNLTLALKIKGHKDIYISDPGRLEESPGTPSIALGPKEQLKSTQGEVVIADSEAESIMPDFEDYQALYFFKDGAVSPKDKMRTEGSKEEGIINEDMIRDALLSGIELGRQGKYDLAISYFNKAIELKPDLAQAYNNRGLAYYFKGNYELALADFDKSIGYSPNDPQAYRNRAVINYFKKEYDKSWDDVHRAEALGYTAGPEFFRFLENLKAASGRKE